MLPHWTENVILVNGINIHYTRTGDGSKPALVLAHGFSDNGLCWLPVARDLEAVYDVILPDARGHGLSARVQAGEEIDMADDLAGLIHALELNRPTVGGHSMGAATSSLMEARFFGLARALVLEDPPWHEPEPPGTPPPTPAPPSSMDNWITQLKKLSETEMIAKCRADNPTWPEVELHPWVQSKIQFDHNFSLAARGARPNWPDVVQAIRCPTLLITADSAKGAIVTPASAQKAAALNPLLRVAQIAHAGHSIRRENYTDYMTAVKEFLREVEK